MNTGLMNLENPLFSSNIPISCYLTSALDPGMSYEFFLDRGQVYHFYKYIPWLTMW